MECDRRSMWMFAALAAGTGACGSDDGPGAGRSGSYVLASVVIDAEGARTTYVQTVDALTGHFDNRAAIEMPGNGVVIAGGRHFFVGLAEEPTWVRYSLGDDGAITESGRLSLLDTGAGAIDYGNAIVDSDTAVSVISDPPLAVVWNPETMQIVGEIDLSSLQRDGYELEVWTTIAHEGKVYVPGRWADWDGGRVFPGVSLTILDPATLRVVGTAEDDRCASGGRVVFGDDGHAYVMGDGRNYAIQMFANASGGSAPPNCLLRIAAGATDFDPAYFHTITSLTGGREAIGELETARQGSGVGFAKMFHEDQLPEGVEPVDFAFWGERAHKMWRLELGDEPTAVEVDGAPFSALGFEGTPVDGHLFTGESLDEGATSDVYEIDPDSNRATLRFTMDGYFYGLYELSR
jgi:hypothetical protein